MNKMQGLRLTNLPLLVRHLASVMPKAEKMPSNSFVVDWFKKMPKRDVYLHGFVISCKCHPERSN